MRGGRLEDKVCFAYCSIPVSTFALTDPILTCASRCILEVRNGDSTGVRALVPLVAQDHVEFDADVSRIQERQDARILAGQNE